jgi:hypothetical protein
MSLQDSGNAAVIWRSDFASPHRAQRFAKDAGRALQAAMKHAKGGCITNYLINGPLAGAKK